MVETGWKKLAKKSQGNTLPTEIFFCWAREFQPSDKSTPYPAPNGWRFVGTMHAVTKARPTKTKHGGRNEVDQISRNVSITYSYECSVWTTGLNISYDHSFLWSFDGVGRIQVENPYFRVLVPFINRFEILTWALTSDSSHLKSFDLKLRMK